MNETTISSPPARSAGAATERPKCDLELEKRADGRLWASRNGSHGPVAIRRLFPWSGEGEHVSLRDGENREFALVTEPEGLDDGSREALEDAARLAGFVLEVTRVLEIEEEVEIRVWRVETRQGPRVFQTRLDDWPRELPHGGILIRDVAGDLYYVADPQTLDGRSRDLLWAFVG